MMLSLLSFPVKILKFGVLKIIIALTAVGWASFRKPKGRWFLVDSRLGHMPGL